MKIYAIRHGLTEMNKKKLINGRSEEFLAPEGIKQAEAAKVILPSTIKHIYASPLNRAKQTAEILNEKLHVPITYHDELMEVYFGKLEGAPYLNEYEDKHKMMTYDWHSVGGEAVDDVKARFLRILSKIIEESKDGEALIVTHGGIIRMMYYLENNEPVGSIDNLSLHTFDTDKLLK